MSEVVNVLVAFAVIVFLFRWVTSGSDSSGQDAQSARRAADALGFRPRNVTNEMVDTVASMFPDIPRDNIRYDLLRTGNTQLTTTKVLERGFLDAPPQIYYTFYPRENQAASPAGGVTGRPPTSTSSSVKKPKDTLISRYNLQERIASGEKVAEEEAGGKATWEDSPEKREASLRERKAQMILAARQRFLAQQQPSSAGS